MEIKKVKPSVLEGTLQIPASKSISHRSVICAALAEGVSKVHGLVMSQDIQVTMDCMQALGAQMHWEEDVLLVRGIGGGTAAGQAKLFCGESGSTLRFLIPIAAALGVSAEFTGAGRLGDRPLSVYEEILPQKGISWSRKEKWLPLTVCGELQGGTYGVRGDISSQFITGLLLALPLLAEDSEIVLTTQLESEPYVKLTLAAMDAFGVHVVKTPEGYKIPGGQTYKACEYTVEGDFSQAAFILCAGALAAGEAGVTLTGLYPKTLQGDAAILDILRDMGADLTWTPEGLLVKKARQLHNITVDASQCPDLVPVVAAIGCCSEGTMRIVNAARLRIKESDRLSAVHDEYEKIGAQIREYPDGLEIDGNPAGYEGGTGDSQNDHRMAMSLAVLALRTQKGITVTDAMSVRKSWPAFWEDFALIGGCYE